MKKNFKNFIIISFLIVIIFTSKLFAQNVKDLQKKAAKAVDAASVCYRSLPSDAQSSTVKTYLEALTYYDDAVKYLNMDQNQKYLAISYFEFAINSSQFVMQIGQAYGSRSCN
jgi:hypothetical protein